MITTYSRKAPAARHMLFLTVTGEGDALTLQVSIGARNRTPAGPAWSATAAAAAAYVEGKGMGTRWAPVA